MSSILGVTVGESAVRIVRPIDRTAPSAGFQFQVMETGKDEPAQLAARTLGVLSQTGIAGEQIDAVGIVYRDKAQADRIRAAMAVEDLDNFTLVSEPEAALAYLQSTGELGSDTAVFYDLGDSGLTVTVVDLGLREVLAERTDIIGGRIFDQVIRDHQLDTNGVWRPDDPATDSELSAQCREAKEKLSATDSVAVPGAAGVVLMSRDTFDPLIGQCVESSAQFVHHVIARSGRNPEAVVLLGGGAHIPLVQEVLRSWIGLPLVVPHEPELVLSKGGAILAGKPQTSQPVSSLTRIVPAAADMTAVTEQIPVVTASIKSSVRSETAVAAAGTKKSRFGNTSNKEPEVSGKQISGAGIAGTALAVIAVIGVGLGAGNGLFSGSSGNNGTSPTETFVTPTTSRTVPRPQPAVAPATVTTTPPVTTTVTQEAPRPVPPAPEPEPPPPPQLIPGVDLPIIQLPTIQLPPLPQIPLPGL